jgi:hypothetical protein
MRRIAHTLIAASFALAACGRDEARTHTDSGDVARVDSTLNAPAATIEELDVEDVTLGKRLNTSRNMVDDATDDFGVRDTIIAVVKTEHAAPGQQLTARWTYGDNNQSVAEQTENVATGSDEARTAFRLTKASAWPKGNYHVRIYNGTKELASKDFEVK